jgi:hypothetical protein
MSKRDIQLSDINPDTIIDAQDLSFNKDSRKKNKYRAEPIDDEQWGHFDSTGEWHRWRLLLQEQDENQISELQRQVVFNLLGPLDVLTDAGHVVVKSVTYKMDFVYFDLRIDRWVVEEWKGMMTRDARLKIILFMHTHPKYLFRMPNGGMQHITRKERKTRTKKGTGSSRPLD